MSLLLDALKKAEKEKQKAREAEATTTENETQQSESPDFDDELSIQQEPEVHHEEVLQAESDSNFDLVLDEDLVDQKEVTRLKKYIPPDVAELEKGAATTSTVSDEALQLLVYKINKKYRQRQKKIWGGLLIVTSIILLSAGSYYYYGMLEEVEALERKHKIAMHSVSIVPIKKQQTEELLKPAKIEQDQPSEVKVDKKGNNQKTVTALTQAIVARNKLSIEKINIEDPINALLRNAWAAYNKSDYLAAERDYKEVLNQEPRNRDALLGVAAVAVKKANYRKARASYQLLLKLNPRDQIAKAGITNLNELASTFKDESQLKFMLQQQPSATHLNFALGNYYARRLQWPEAQAEYFKAWQGDINNADYAYNLAVGLDQLGKVKQAVQFYKESLLLARGKNIGFSEIEVEKRIRRILLK